VAITAAVQVVAVMPAAIVRLLLAVHTELYRLLLVALTHTRELEPPT
jgi:hypothetical protein